MYQVVNIEISGMCNAKCPWCVTGNKYKYSNMLDVEGGSSLHSEISGSPSNNFITIPNFSNIIDCLLKSKIIGKQTCINLYNWGEPLLHPEFNQIIEKLCEKNLLFGISTNSSHLVDVDMNSMSNLVHLELSMPGFSQASYDRVHGFKFSNILINIEKTISRFRKAGYHGSPNLVYHIYQFNIHEMESARTFCKKNKLHFLPYVAYLNDFYLALGYLQSTLTTKQMKDISKDLLLYYVDEMLSNKPKEYRCPQYDMLSIDEKCNVLTCCMVPRTHPDYTIGSFFSLSPEEILSKKTKQNICNECLSSGLAYWGHQSFVPKFVKFEDTLSNCRSLVFRRIPKPFLRVLRNSYYRLHNLIKN